MAPAGAAGWQEHVDGSSKLQDLVLVDPDSGLHMLPTELVMAAGAPDMLLGTDPMAALLTELRQQYSFIILDLPAALPYADTQLLRPHVDGMLIVAAWGTTDRRAVAQCMGRRASDHDRVVGVVLNKTPAKIAKRLI
jgi:Mrp family chromosome partitioning ATPase